MRRRDFLSIASMTLLGAWAAPGRAAQGPAAKSVAPARAGDAAEEMAYPKFNMGGRLNYTFAPAGELVEFFTFDSTKVVETADTSQLDWLEKALKDSKAQWKIAFFHHPPFSPGKRHGDNPILDERLVPILERGGANVVLTGHEHFFARMREQNGVNYIISGSGGKIHTGGILPDPRMVAGNDALHQFLSVTLTRDAVSFSCIGEDASTIYTESIPYARAAAAAAGAGSNRR
jgi:3',5'-cyclic AMP phosphodiesterase CpdA